MSMKKTLEILKRVAGTLMLPVIMFVIMKIMCDANGYTFFGTTIPAWTSSAGAGLCRHISLSEAA